jgi:hypothetical protein
MLWTGVLLVLPFFAYAPLSAAMGDELAVGHSRTCCVLEDTYMIMTAPACLPWPKFDPLLLFTGWARPWCLLLPFRPHRLDL